MTDLYSLVRPLIGLIPPETAHGLTISLLKTGLVRGRGHRSDDPVLATRIWGLSFPNPVGLAAGFDKDAEVLAAVLGMGFGFVEAGTVTPKPQPGNPRPRMFRLPRARAVINRFGFNSKGLENFTRNLAAINGREGRSGIIGANVGKNREARDAAADYAAGIRACAPLADYLVVNVSSPNTPGLRDLQSREQLAVLIEAALRARDEGMAGRDTTRPPLLLKIAPDLPDDDRADIADLALQTGVDGLIIGNTTLSRPDGITDPHLEEQGGLSGRPLFPLSTAVLSDMYRRTGGRIPLIGVGGVASGEDAYAKIRAGASLVQLYTALAYEGPGLVHRIKADLAALLRRDGFASVSAAVGADHKGISNVPPTPSGQS